MGSARWFLSCFGQQSKQHHSAFDSETTDQPVGKALNLRSSASSLSGARSFSPLSSVGKDAEAPFAAGAAPRRAKSESLDDSEARVDEALRKVEGLVQRFAEMRSDVAMLKTLSQAMCLITEEWQGAFARIHVVEREHALVLAAAPKSFWPQGNPRTGRGSLDAATPKKTSFRSRNSTAGTSSYCPSPTASHTGGTTQADPLLLSLSQPDLAISAALASSTGRYSWIKEQDGGMNAPPDYQVYVDAGAIAVFSVVMKLAGTSSAVLTIGFTQGSDMFTHKLWNTFLRVIASGIALVLGPSAPRYLDLALGLKEVTDLGGAMSTVVRRLRLLSGQASNSQMWFRVALKLPDGSGRAVVFDVPSEVTPSLRSRRLSSTASSSQLAVSPRNSNPPRGAPCRTASTGRYGGMSSQPIDAAGVALSLGTRSVTPPMSDPTVGTTRANDGSLRTVVALERTLLRAALEGCNQVAVPDVQKLLNHGGLVAADIFSMHEIRPPASVLLLPLVEPAYRAGGETCYGAVYVMSSVLTDFNDIKQQLLEVVVDVLSPHLHAVICREPVASQLLDCKVEPLQSVCSLPDLQPPAHQLSRRRRSGLSRGSQVAGDAGVASGSSTSDCDVASRPPGVGPPASYAGGAPSNLTSAVGSGDYCNSSATSYTKALVTGLTDKINSHRMIQSMDSDQVDGIIDLQLLNLLGVGGYGWVFNGRWRGLKVAIKLIKPTKSHECMSRAALKHAHEIAILSSVSHPNIIQAYQFLTDVHVCDVVDLCMDQLDPLDRREPALKELMNLEQGLCHLNVLELCDQGSLMDALKRATQKGGKPLPSAFASRVPQMRKVPSARRIRPRHVMGPRRASSASLAVLSPLVVQATTAAAAAAFAAATANSGGSELLLEPLPGPLFPDLPTLVLSLVELASALAHLHSLGIVHCDIKPDNILIKSSTNDGRGFTTKLGDFGLSRVLDNGCVSFPCNSCGTLAYVAPEALANKRVDQSIDVYSFGILMYELFTCRRPYVDIKREHMVHGVTFMNLRPVFPAGSHPGYVQLARACWSQVPGKRPTFQEVAMALNDMLPQVCAHTMRFEDMDDAVC